MTSCGALEDQTRYVAALDGDQVRGDSGSDHLFGNTGNDRMGGGSGDDRLEGQDGNDDMTGGNGRDVLLGGLGRDDLSGDSGNDRLVGGANIDHLDGGIGNDTLLGGSGADVFEFDRTDVGRDHIQDWTAGEDQLNVSDFDFSLDEVLATGVQVGADVAFQFTTDDVVFVHNATLGAFGADDFILS